MRGLRNQTESSRAQANAPAQKPAGSSRRGWAAAGANARLPTVAPSRLRRIGELQSDGAPEQSKERTRLSPRRNGRASIASGRPLPAARRLPKSPSDLEKTCRTTLNRPTGRFFSLFFSEKEGCEESLTPSSPGVRFAQTANIPPPKPPLKRQVGASSSNRQAAVGAGAGAVFLRCCWMPKFLSFLASLLLGLLPFSKKKEERKPPATKLNLNFGALARSCLTTPFASHMIAPSPRRRIGAAPLRELVERTLSNYSYFGVQFECMRS